MARKNIEHRIKKEMLFLDDCLKLSVGTNKTGITKTILKKQKSKRGHSVKEMRKLISACQQMWDLSRLD